MVDGNTISAIFRLPAISRQLSTINHPRRSVPHTCRASNLD